MVPRGALPPVPLRRVEVEVLRDAPDDGVFGRTSGDGLTSGARLLRIREGEGRLGLPRKRGGLTE